MALLLIDVVIRIILGLLQNQLTQDKGSIDDNKDIIKFLEEFLKENM